MNKVAVAVLGFASLVCCSVLQAKAADSKTPVSDRQLAVMMFVDYGRSYGYQTMMARIHVDTVKADLERDRQVLKQKEELYGRKAIPPIELEIAQLKDIWNQKQLVVAEKNLAYVSAEYEAMAKMAKHFGGVEIPVESLYESFRRGWQAGCDKGPDEVAAMKAWAEFSEKALERARQLNSQGNESLSAVYQKEAQLKIARSNYENRRAGLERCLAVLFPSLEDVLSVGR
jgi:hypothetical protein